MTAQFRVYGHRGAAAHHPENTARSFHAAMDDGADALETDVRMSRDGEMVVFHDADGARTCGVERLIIDSSWSEIRTWNAGEGEHPILLDEMLETWPDTFINIDVKDASVDAARRTLDIIASRKDSIGLGSFHRNVARFIDESDFGGQLAFVTHEVVASRFLPGFVARRIVRGNAAQIPVTGSGIRLDIPGFVERLHAMGCRLDYWTIDDPEEAVRLVRLGADGIVTNDPKAITTALEAAGLRHGASSR
ncbi:MAG: glycerophosphodiester phosphodiesterase family protein [Myxococcota bacterium]